MINFKKRFITKLILFFIIAVFLSQQLVYGVEFSHTLRKEMDFSRGGKDKSGRYLEYLKKISVDKNVLLILGLVFLTNTGIGSNLKADNVTNLQDKNFMESLKNRISYPEGTKVEINDNTIVLNQEGVYWDRYNFLRLEVDKGGSIVMNYNQEGFLENIEGSGARLIFIKEFNGLMFEGNFKVIVDEVKNGILRNVNIKEAVLKNKASSPGAASSSIVSPNDFIASNHDVPLTIIFNPDLISPLITANRCLHGIYQATDVLAFLNKDIEYTKGKASLPPRKDYSESIDKVFRWVEFPYDKTPRGHPYVSESKMEAYRQFLKNKINAYEEKIKSWSKKLDRLKADLEKFQLTESNSLLILGDYEERDFSEYSAYGEMSLPDTDGMRGETTGKLIYNSFVDNVYDNKEYKKAWQEFRESIVEIKNRVRFPIDEAKMTMDEYVDNREGIVVSTDVKEFQGHINVFGSHEGYLNMVRDTVIKMPILKDLFVIAGIELNQLDRLPFSNSVSSYHKVAEETFEDYSVNEQTFYYSIYKDKEQLLYYAISYAVNHNDEAVLEKFSNNLGDNIYEMAMQYVKEETIKGMLGHELVHYIQSLMKEKYNYDFAKEWAEYVRGNHMDLLNVVKNSYVSYYSHSFTDSEIMIDPDMDYCNEIMAFMIGDLLWDNKPNFRADRVDIDWLIKHDILPEQADQLYSDKIKKALDDEKEQKYNSIPDRTNKIRNNL